MSEVQSLKIILTSGRTIEQGVSLVGTKITKLAKDATAVCFLDPNDMEKLHLSEDQNIEIQTSEGSIVVRAKLSKDAPHEGIAFIPLGIYANWVTPPGDAGIGVPKYKGIDAIISPTTKKVLEVNDLLNILLEHKDKN
ncbi:MAG TPA: molybdopterin dinucleotide binding domain-containing protein [Candidatus Bathyarchaeia archaeon]|nr:molybdopterin dinucleotide binding domain-containing protein [Candidatus Bathyarchaeia archaeon]